MDVDVSGRLDILARHTVTCQTHTFCLYLPIGCVCDGRDKSVMTLYSQFLIPSLWFFPTSFQNRKVSQKIHMGLSWTWLIACRQELVAEIDPSTWWMLLHPEYLGMEQDWPPSYQIGDTPDVVVSFFLLFFRPPIVVSIFFNLKRNNTK